MAEPEAIETRRSWTRGRRYPRDSGGGVDSPLPSMPAARNQSTPRLGARIRGAKVQDLLFALLCCADVTSRFLYALFLGLDANFRMKRKKVSSDERDPSLSEGWGCFVKEEPYKEHLTKHWDQKQDVRGHFPSLIRTV